MTVGAVGDVGVGVDEEEVPELPHAQINATKRALPEAARIRRMGPPSDLGDSAEIVVRAQARCQNGSRIGQLCAGLIT